MKRSMLVLMAVCLFFSLAAAAEASNYRFTWECTSVVCSFSANPLPNVQSYDWKFGDGTYGTGQSTSHIYTPNAGSGHYTPRVTLSYRFTNGSVANARCYILYYRTGGAGGDPIDDYYAGTCDGFN